MKSQTVVSWTLALSFLLLCACRADDEFSVPTASAAPVTPTAASFEGEIKDPPKDVPKDYDNWKQK